MGTPHSSPEPQAIPPLDAGFVLTESSTTTWHIVGVVLLDVTEAAEPLTVDRVRRLVSSRLDRLEAFRLRLVPGWPRPRWVEAASVDLDVHVLAATVPGLEGLAGLADLAGQVASRPLDRARPLWEVHVVERVDDGRAALVVKVHHALADGVSAVGLLAGLLDLEPTPVPAAPVRPAVPPRRLPHVDVGLQLSNLARWPGTAVGAVSRLGRSGWRTLDAARRSGRWLTLPFSGPRTGMHRRLTSRRQVAMATLSLADVKRVRAAAGCTFNDVVLATCAGALRSWLDSVDDLPGAPLVAVVPTSTHGGPGAPGRNQVSALLVAMPTHLADPLERLQAVQAETSRSKAAHDEFGPDTLAELAGAAPWRLLGLLWGVSWRLGTAGALPPVANLLVTSVPGPPVPLYLAGARLAGLFPFGPVLEGVPLNITVISREDEVEVGILSCPDAAPDTRPLAAAMAEALAELVARVA